MSNTLSGQNLGVFPYNLDGLQNIDVNSINGQQLDFSNLVQYKGNTDDLDMGPYNIKTAHTAAANNDVVNLLSLTSRMSALTGYILGINGLNYVPYTGGTANTVLGSYGLSAGNITANSFLNVGGASVLSGNITAISNLNVNGLTTLARGQTNFTAVSSLDITNKAYVDTSVATAIANISVGSSILATNNIFTGTNQYNNNVSTGLGYTTDLNGVIQTKLNSLGFTAASFTTSGITGTYTPPLGTITNPSGTTYQITQTAQGRSVMAISGFAPSVQTTYIFQFNIKCTVGTAILSVEQDNILRSPQYYQLSTSFNTIIGTFYYDGNPNTIIFKIYTGVASWNAQWDSFTLSTYSAAINNPLTLTNQTTGTPAFTLGINSSKQIVTFANTIIPANNVTGSMTTNYLPVATGAYTLGDSLISQTAYDITVNGGIYCGVIDPDTGIGREDNRAMNSKVCSGGLNKFAFGSWANNNSSPFADCIFMNNYTDSSGGDTNILMVKKSGFGIRQYQGAYNSASTMTNYNDCCMKGTGDNSTTLFGPNSTWNAYLSVGSGTDKSGASTAQVLSTNGNLHLDAGNSNDIYYGYYPSSRGTPNTHQFYGTSFNFPSGLPQNGTSFAQVAVFDGNTLKKSQAVQKLVYFNNNVAWGGGVNMTYAFYLYNTACNVQFWGKNSGYYSGAGMMQTTIRVYSQSGGQYYYYPINAFVNNGYNHFTVPLNYAASFPYTGWYDIYVYSTSGWITDGNDQLTIGVSILPAGSF